MDTREGERAGFRPVMLLAYFGAMVILAIPIAFAGFGVFIAAIDFPSLVFIVCGAALLGLSWGLLPQRRRVPDDCLQSNDLPALFALLDRISQELSAPRIQHVLFTREFNAATYSVSNLWGQRQNVLIIGLTFWESLDADERLALLAHQVGHLVNSDPRQGVVLGYAMETLERWMFWFRPTQSINDFGGISFVGQVFNLIMEAFGLILRGCWRLLYWALAHDQQISIYVADTWAATVAGKAVGLGLLNKLLFFAEVDRPLRGMRMRGKQKDGWIFDLLADGVRNLPEEERKKMRDYAAKEQSSLDDRCPPTAFRMAFVDDLPEVAPLIEMTPEEFRPIEFEILPYKNALGASWVSELQYQEY